VITSGHVIPVDPTDAELAELATAGLTIGDHGECPDPADRGRRVPWWRALELLRRDRQRDPEATTPRCVGGGGSLDVDGYTRPPCAGKEVLW
jgi:hypothetical protein